MTCNTVTSLYTHDHSYIIISWFFMAVQWAFEFSKFKVCESNSSGLSKIYKDLSFKNNKKCKFCQFWPLLLQSDQALCLARFHVMEMIIKDRLSGKEFKGQRDVNTKSVKTRNFLLIKSGTKNVETVRNMNCPESLRGVWALSSLSALEPCPCLPLRTLTNKFKVIFLADVTCYL